MSTSPKDDSNQAAKPKRTWFKVRVVAAALVLLIGFGAWLSWRNGLPPRVIAPLSQGRVYLDVPQMTLYTFPPLQADGFYATTNFSVTSSTAITFTWANATGVGLPVRFVLRDNGLAEAGPANGFVFRPAESGAGFRFAANKPGIGGVVYSTWAMDYEIRELAANDWLGEDRWIEVDYALAAVSSCVCDLPAANTTLPPPGTLTPVGSPVHARYDSGFAWSFSVSVHQVSLPEGPFLHSLPLVSLPAGTAGTIRVVLQSSFRWGAGDDYVMNMGASNGANVSLQLYVDTRFGSLLAESIP